MSVHRHINRCCLCGNTIKASQAYIVRPQLVERTNVLGRRYRIWSKPHYHVACIKRQAA